MSYPSLRDSIKNNNYVIIVYVYRNSEPVRLFHII